MVAYPGCQLLDVTGPAAVFGAANEGTVALGRQAPYELRIASPDGGACVTSAGVTLGTVKLGTVKLGGLSDTILVAGGAKGMSAMIARDDARRWMNTAAKKARRYGSVCSGALILAAWRLLDGKRVATHWSSTARCGPRPA
jgi:transcriptional regulator GlxA family with amidase domain